MYGVKSIKVLAPVNVAATNYTCDWSCPHIRSRRKKNVATYQSVCSLFRTTAGASRILKETKIDDSRRALRCSPCMEGETHFNISQLVLN